MRALLGIGAATIAIVAGGCASHTTPQTAPPAPSNTTQLVKPAMDCTIVNPGNRALPEFQIYISNSNQTPININTVNIVGYSGNAEIGSTTVNINTIVVGGKAIEFNSPLPTGWYTENTNSNQPDEFTPNLNTCQVIGE